MMGETLIPEKQRVADVLKAARRVVNAERRCARLRKGLDEAEQELRTARRFARGVIGDVIGPGENRGELPGDGP